MLVHRFWFVGATLYFLGAIVFFLATLIQQRFARLLPTEETRMMVIYEYSCAEHRVAGGACDEKWEK